MNIHIEEVFVTRAGGVASRLLITGTVTCDGGGVHTLRQHVTVPADVAAYVDAASDAERQQVIKDLTTPFATHLCAVDAVAPDETTDVLHPGDTGDFDAAGPAPRDIARARAAANKLPGGA